MSTRATYQFKNSKDKFAAKTTIYIHHDGYPEGAATYFYRLLINESNGDLATQFIRANDGAEITKSHEVHGDTEYRYDIDGNGPEAAVTCYKRDWNKPEGSQWISTQHSTLVEFVARFPAMIKDFKPFQKVTCEYGTVRTLNEVTAKQWLDSQYGPLGHLKVWREHNSQRPGACNWDNQVKNLRAIVAAFPQLSTPEIEQFISPSESSAVAQREIHQYDIPLERLGAGLAAGQEGGAQ